MKLQLLAKLSLLFILEFFFIASFAFGASTSSALLKAKQDSEAKGYIFITNHDEIVAEAKKEGKLRVNSGTERATFKPLIDAFKKRYPFVTDIHLEEIQGADAYQRFILEIKSGHAKGWDTTHVPLDFASDYMPYMKKYDILAMAEHGVLTIDPRMIHPVERNIVGYTSTIQVISYNKKLLVTRQEWRFAGGGLPSSRERSS